MYLIKSIGIDLASVNSGIMAISVRNGTWERKALDAAAVSVVAVGDKPLFNCRMDTAKRLLDFVFKHKPDIVGIEEFIGVHKVRINGVAYAEMGGIVRTLLWESGIPFVSINTSKFYSFVETEKHERKDGKGSWMSGQKQLVVEWVKKILDVDFEGSPNQISNMADAGVYAMIAALTFAEHWLDADISKAISQRQLHIFHAQKKTGLLDSNNYIVRNAARECKYDESRRLGI